MFTVPRRRILREGALTRRGLDREEFRMVNVVVASRSRVCSPDTIASFIQQTIVELESFKVGMRRAESRESAAIPIFVAPLNENLEPVGAEFYAVTRDVSCGGIGLFHTKPVTARWLEIEMSTPATRQELRLLAQVQHCTPIGKFFLIGCRFATAGDE